MILTHNMQLKSFFHFRRRLSDAPLHTLFGNGSAILFQTARSALNWALGVA